MSQRVAPPPTSSRKVPHQLWLGVAGAALISLAAGGSWLFIREASESPKAELERALAKLDRPDDPAAWEVAKRIATRLQQKGYRDPQFPGATEFILGIATVRALDPAAPLESSASRALKSLKEAEEQGVVPSRRPEWALALGSLYYRLNQPRAARDLLWEAWSGLGDRRVAAGLLLADLELTHAEVRDNEQLHQILEQLSSEKELDLLESRDVHLLKARFALDERQFDEAESALKELNDRDPTDLEVAILRARVEFTRGLFDVARNRLYPIVFDGSVGVPPSQSAAASYLLGQCDEQRGESLAAIRAYERAVGLAPASPDGVLAAVAAAHLLQKSGRDEEALKHFRAAIVSLSEHESLSVSAEAMRQAIRLGWDEWVKRGSFELAISLAQASQSVLTRAEASELCARATEQAAQALEAEWSRGGMEARRLLQTDRLRFWRRSGEAFRQLSSDVADISQTSSSLLTAADHYRKGHAFLEAEAALTSLLELKIASLEPRALVERGKNRLDLGRPLDALEDFQAVITHFPTDPVAFEAYLHKGYCHLDAGRLEQAETAWRELLALPNLSPDAMEWRESLFSLARSCYQRGVSAAIHEGGEANSTTSAALLPLDEAIASFDEFLRRAPQSGHAHEARILRADAMQRRARISLRMSRQAETQNLRSSYEQEAKALLEGALAELRVAQEALLPRASRDRLTPLEEELLQSSYFGIGHSYYLLRRNEEAIVAYSAAINRDPDDPRAIGTFVRIAECHRRLGRVDDVRAAIEQAKLLMVQSSTMRLDGAMSALTRSDWETWLARLGSDDLAEPFP